MMQTQDLMKVRGKRGRPVPVLVPKDCRRPLAFLADKSSRINAGITTDNSYLFPNTVNFYARAYESLKSVCSEVKLSAPHRITSVSMRKYTATLTQMLDLDKYQVEWVCNHLGHTSKVHKEHYRQMSGLLERTHISKLLLIQDLNLTGKYKGKKLEEMDIRDIVFPDQEDGSEISQEMSVHDDFVDAEEEGFLIEDEDEDGNEMELNTKRVKMKAKRKRWSQEEVNELRKYFDDYFKSRTTPRFAHIEKVKARSKKDGGKIHLRENHLIVKKISNMNHAVEN